MKTGAVERKLKAAHLRGEGKTYAEIGRLLGPVSTSRAQQLVGEGDALQRFYLRVTARSIDALQALWKRGLTVA